MSGGLRLLLRRREGGKGRKAKVSSTSVATTMEEKIPTPKLLTLPKNGDYWVGAISNGFALGDKKEKKR
jgi:hypothetical protein